MRITALLLLLPLIAAQEDPSTERLLRVIEKAYLEAGDPFDARAKAAALGYDRDRIFAFVRDEIAYEPYDGVLRGAGGTLFAGSGNSLDQALLLKALLEACGEEARIVTTELSDTSALRKKFLSQEPFARLRQRPKAGPDTADLLGADRGMFEDLVRERERREAEQVEEVVEGAVRESARLLKTVGGELAGGELKIPRTHYWVRAGEKDLDPCAIECDRSGAEEVRDLAPLRRRIAFRLALTREVGGKTEDVQLLNIAFPLGEVAWKPIHLVIEPSPEHFPSSKDFTKLDAKGRAGALKKAKVFQAGMLIDCKPYGSAPFDLYGRTYKVTKDGRVAAAEKLGKSIGDAFGKMFGEGEDKEPPSKLKALTFEVSVGKRVHKRVLFAADGSAMPIVGASILVETSLPPDGEMERRELRFLWRNLDTFRSIFAGKFDGLRVKAHCRFSSILLSYADLRRRVLARLLGKDRRFFRDRPGVVMEVRRMRWDGPDRVRFRHSLDIMENHITFVNASGKYLSELNLTFGVADTALESLLLVRSDPADTVASAWVIMERERLLGGKQTVKGALEISWGDGAKWCIDPATGACVGRIASGEGQGMVEYAWDLAGKVCQFGVFLGMYAGTVGSDTAKKADQLMGDLCCIVDGSWARRVVENKINKMRDGMWKAATDALAGK
ncbi:MAG: hypothetical protein ACYTAF_03725 [Planctomycetota bacterium]